MPRTGDLIERHSSEAANGKHPLRRRLVDLAVLLLLLYVIVPQIGAFHHSLSIAKHADGWWLLTGVVIALLTYLPAALTYRLLALYKLRYLRTVVVEVASSFVDRLLPAGIGSMSVNFSNLRHQNHSQAEAGVVIAANTLLGVIGLILLVVLAALANHTVISQLHFSHVNPLYYWVLVVLVLVVCVTAFVSKRAHRAVRKILSSVRHSLTTYRHRPLKLTGALLSSMSLTILYSLSLLACTRATGLSLSFPHALLVLALGGVGGAIAPTPGGLVGVEAGIVAGLVAYGAPSSEALAATLLYRLVTYWFMLLLGLVVYALIRQKGII